MAHPKNTQNDPRVGDARGANATFLAPFNATGEWALQQAAPPLQMLREVGRFWRASRISGWLLLGLSLYLVLVIKLITLQGIRDEVLFGGYSIAVCVFLLSRLFLGSLYKPHVLEEGSFEPTITFGVPCKNEEQGIRDTLLAIARSDYPRSKFNIIVINDGSTDGTLQEMMAAKGEIEREGIPIEVIHWPKNRGKRAGMAECIRRSSHDIVIFVDSDSVVEPQTTRKLMKYFTSDRVAAVTGHGYVANGNKNFITKMQELRYFVSFRAYKGAEALFGAVTCCSGCCSAYRRQYLLEVLEKWQAQAYLGVACTYGDDRSLTNFLLEKGYRTMYAPDAPVHTSVPETFRKYTKQQLRWKKSWIRETLKSTRYIWRRHPVMALSFYLSAILPLLSPVVVARVFIWLPYSRHSTPIYYLLGLMLMALIFGLYYYLHTGDRRWFWGILAASFGYLVLIWQMPYALLRLRDSRWGTR